MIQSLLLHFFFGAIATLKRALAAFIAKLKGVVLKKFLGTPPQISLLGPAYTEDRETLLLPQIIYLVSIWNTGFLRPKKVHNFIFIYI